MIKLKLQLPAVGIPNFGHIKIQWKEAAVGYSPMPFSPKLNSFDTQSDNDWRFHQIDGGDDDNSHAPYVCVCVCVCVYAHVCVCVCVYVCLY